MKDKLGQAPAFPQETMIYKGGNMLEVNEIFYGMSTRLLLAGMAMQGFCSNPSYTNLHSDDIAECALMQADKLLSQEAL